MSETVSLCTKSFQTTFCRLPMIERLGASFSEKQQGSVVAGGWRESFPRRLHLSMNSFSLQPLWVRRVETEPVVCVHHITHTPAKRRSVTVIKMYKLLTELMMNFVIHQLQWEYPMSKWLAHLQFPKLKKDSDVKCKEGVLIRCKQSVSADQSRVTDGFLSRLLHSWLRRK